MASVNRDAWHNTSIRSSANCGTKLAGLYAAVGITNANLYSMLEIVCIITSTFFYKSAMVERRITAAIKRRVIGDETKQTPRQGNTG